MHLLIERAVAEAKHVVQLSKRFIDADRALEGTVVRARFIVARSANHHELRGRTAGDLDEAVVPVVVLHRDVESRTMTLDMSQLGEQRGELRGCVLPLDVLCLAKDSSTLVRRK